MVDGKELVRSSESTDGRFDGETCHLYFTSNSKHVYYTSHVSLGNQRGQSFTRFVFDGKPSPTGSAGDVAFSPDGDHYAYNLTISDPYHQDRYALVVDGKIAPYMAGAPQWTADSKHVYTQRTVPGQGTELLFDGKPLMRAFGFRVYIPPVEDMVVVAVTGGTNFHPFSFLVVNGKKVPGSDTVERGMIDRVEFSSDGNIMPRFAETPATIITSSPMASAGRSTTRLTRLRLLRIHRRSFTQPLLTARALSWLEIKSSGLSAR